MNYKAEVRDGKLIVMIDVSDKAIAAAVVSKSAAAKAAEKGLPAPAPSLIATTGGFTTVGSVRLSLNVTKL